jgi:hypothetical protein
MDVPFLYTSVFNWGDLWLPPPWLGVALRLSKGRRPLIPDL